MCVLSDSEAQQQLQGGFVSVSCSYPRFAGSISKSTTTTVSASRTWHYPVAVLFAGYLQSVTAVEQTSSVNPQKVACSLSVSGGRVSVTNGSIQHRRNA